MDWQTTVEWHKDIALEDTAMSFEEWKEHGCHVMRGSKCGSWSFDGKAQFTADQVRVNGSWRDESLWRWIQKQLQDDE